MTIHQKTRTVILAALLAALTLTGVARAQSDFGDAPDGTLVEYPSLPPLVGGFPTAEFTANSRYPGNVGVEHIVTDVVWLGGATSVTTLEVVPNLTDLDVDDSGAFWWISLTGIPAGATLDVPITLGDDAPPGPYFLNVLVDQNNDGPIVREWVVVDGLIDQAPGTTQRYGVPVPWSASLLILPKWVRITVSDVPLQPLMAWGSDGWDGSVPAGSPLTVGETEDRFVGAVYPGTAGPGGGPPPGPGGGGVAGGAGGGANGKGIPGKVPAPAGGACLMRINCQPRNQTIPCGGFGTVTCEIKYLSGQCPDTSPGCNAEVSPTFIKHLRGSGPKAVVSPATQCTKVGPGNRSDTLTFSVTFPPPCDQQWGRKQRWRFALLHDPEGLYGAVSPDEREGIVLSSTMPTCGNGFPDPPFEACDDGNLLAGDGCGADCQVEFFIPDGILGPGEECDDGNTLPGDGCSPLGLREHCGNMRLDMHEACDDGNTTSGDGCSEFCMIEGAASCGNGLIDHVLEQCDDANDVDGDGCDAYCQTEMCGDGALDFGEECDDGNTLGGDGCDPACLSEGSCGNGWIDGGESCDDGNTLDEDGCSSICQLAAIHVPELRWLADKETLQWDSVIAPRRFYDVHRGEIGELRSSGGGLDGAGSACLARALHEERLSDTTVPSSGTALYYLVRVDAEWLATTTYAPMPPAAGATGDRDLSTLCD